MRSRRRTGSPRRTRSSREHRGRRGPGRRAGPGRGGGRGACRGRGARRGQAERAAAERARTRPGPSEDDVRALIQAAIELVNSVSDGGGLPGGGREPVSAGWVAGSVRARALARRRIGADEARRLAACRLARARHSTMLAATAVPDRSQAAGPGGASRAGPAARAQAGAGQPGPACDRRGAALGPAGTGRLAAAGRGSADACAGRLVRDRERGRAAAGAPGRPSGQTFRLGRAGDSLAAAAAGGHAGRAAGSTGQLGVEGPGRRDRGRHWRWGCAPGGRSGWPALGEPARTWAAALSHCCSPGSGSAPGGPPIRCSGRSRLPCSARARLPPARWRNWPGGCPGG